MDKNQFEIKSNKRISLLSLMAIFFILPGTLFSQIKAVWALGDGEKVFREDLQHPSKNGNFIWDGKTIHLKGLYNEVLAFQVIIETGSDGAGPVEVAVDGPVNKSSGRTIGGNSLKYGPAGTIEIFSQHYLQVRKDRSTPPAWFYGSPAAAPKQMIGSIPDALIPADAKSGSGGFPVNVGPSRNQGFWIDLHLPRDQKDFPSGLYQGTVQVFAKGELVNKIPLELTLLPGYLPDENNTNIWLYTSSVNSYFPELSEKQVDEMLKFEGHRHRINVAGGFSVNTSPYNEEKMNEYKPWLDGSAFTPANGYRGPGQGKGEKIFPVGMYGSNVLGNNKTDVQRQADLWVNWFKKNAPDVIYFWYITDEPPQSRYPWIKERADWIHSNPGAGKDLPVFTTTRYSEELNGAIDIFASGTGLELKNLSAARENGGDHWFYNGYRPRYGSVILEAAAVDFRVNSWILYKYGINCHFIWHGTHWRHNSQGPKAGLHQNIFQNPGTFANFGATSYGNGDGVLFYPGRMPYYPEEDRGLNKLLPSIRLKNIRRGQQDAAIMWMAEKKIGREKVIEIISKVLPKALSEVERDQPVPWSESGDEYDKVRDYLLGIITN